ncbi:hypothetical protein P43SY_009175 [Pythium insidiosum]|uniref:Uncharacterized protein n=1 Tax=Pythium insidiosum TaxID=114742 RepID=A0AAD5Q9Z8_PYTIN|nr:hypothetical protein P43SY_009175 [Pythium insidiosum]
MSSWESGAFAAIQGGEEHSDRVPQQQPPKKKKHPGAGAERLAMATADDVVSPTSSSSSNRSQGEAFALPTVDDVSTVELMAPALHSIWRQQPWAFEFNEVLLSSMYDHVFSGVYGGNGELTIMANDNADADAERVAALDDGPIVANGASAAPPKKRLLPMELRRRRRAAKLQITSERNVATINARDMIANLDMLGDDSAAAEEPSPAAAPSPLHVPTPLLPSKRARDGDVAKGSSPREPHRSGATGETKVTSAESSSSRPAPSTTAKLQKLFSLGASFDRRRAKTTAGESRPDVPLTLRVESVPLDVTPKSKVVVTTPYPFPFARPSTRSLAVALTTPSDAARQLDAETQWLRSTQLFVHPASALPPSLVISNEKQVEETEFYVHRFRVWQDAFRAAYLGWRQRSPQSLREQSLYLHCSDFIVCFHHAHESPEADANGTVSLLERCRRHGSSTSQPKSPRLTAVISHSNARLRKDLQRVNGSMGQTLFCSSTATKPFTASLSNQDVPEIIGFQPFTNATIRSVDVRYLGKATAAPTDTDGQPEAFRIEITGFATTAIAHDMIKCLQAKIQQEGWDDSTSQSFRVVMETMPLGERLNAVFLDSKIAPQAAGMASETRAVWKHELELAKRRLQAITIASSSMSSASSSDAIDGVGNVVIEMTARAT